MYTDYSEDFHVFRYLINLDKVIFKSSVLFIVTFSIIREISFQKYWIDCYEKTRQCINYLTIPIIYNGNNRD